MNRGIQSGVLLLHLDGLRRIGFVDQVRTVFDPTLTVPKPGRCPTNFGPYDFGYGGDQCILNYFLNVTPAYASVLPSTYNW